MYILRRCIFSSIISKQKRITLLLILKIIIELLEQHGIPYEKFDCSCNIRLKGFIINSDNKRIGYSFTEIESNADNNKIINEFKLDKLFGVLFYNDNDIIESTNRGYKCKQDERRVVSFKDFFCKFFSIQEYEKLISYMEKYLDEAKRIIGYKSIRVLSPMYLAEQKNAVESLLKNWNYYSESYQILNSTNEQLKGFLYLANYSFPSEIVKCMTNNYLSKGIYKTMVGGNDYAESFMTSEWLFDSIKEQSNYDYTTIISGYLKSIEQLLYKIVMLNVDNNCKIVISKKDGIPDEIKNKNIPLFRYDSKKCKWNKTETIGVYPYIDFTTNTTKYMDSSIGTFEYFLRYNPHIFIDQSIAKKIADMVSCFRTECRNGYFHIHNLHKKNIVEITRSNAIFLYYVLLGGCIIPQTKYEELVFQELNDFDKLCIKIRDFRNYSIDFIFEYKEGKKLKLVYDIKNNVASFTNNGLQHYKLLSFYQVEDFTEEEYKKIDCGLAEKYYLTRETIPNIITGIHRNKQKEVIYHVL